MYVRCVLYFEVSTVQSVFPTMDAKIVNCGRISEQKAATFSRDLFRKNMITVLTIFCAAEKYVKLKI